MLRRAFLDATVWGLVAGLPAFAFFWLKTHPEIDFTYAAPTGHFYVVSVVSVLSAVLALISAVGAVRTANARIVLLALSFTTMAGMFAVHGLATPGFLVDREFTAVLGFSARMSLLLSAMFLALSAVDLPQAAARLIVRWRVPILVGAVLARLAYGAGGLMWPAYIPPRVMSEQIFPRGTLALVLALSLYAAVRYYEGCRRAALTLYGASSLVRACAARAIISCVRTCSIQ